MINGLAYDKQVVNMTFTDPNGGTSHAVYLQMSRVQFLQPKVDRGSPYVMVTTNFNAEANTTDAVSSYSPLTSHVLNAVSAAY